jgi:two-component system response regulator AtoC
MLSDPDMSTIRRLLVVDDDRAMREMLSSLFKERGLSVEDAASADAALARAAEQDFDVVLSDVRMPGLSGVELVGQLRRLRPGTPVVLMTAFGSIDTAVEAMRTGAFDYLTKPFEPDAVILSVERALAHRALALENEQLRRAVDRSGSLGELIGKSPAMREIFALIRRIAHTRSSVLITGESGTGKEVIADLTHAMSTRNKGRIIKINCAALPRELIESELFGSVKGAFTGAHSDREGLFRQAEGGTLFLDEISEMPIDTQSKLLRVLQDQEVRPVGGKVSYKTNCRLIAATNRKPEEAIKDGKMREDLYYRISAISVHLPPLRERRDDIIPLANAFLKRFAGQANRSIRGFTPAAADRLTGFDWPGNVRQLQNEIQRAVLLSEGDQVDASDLSITRSKPEGIESQDTNFTLLEGVERNAIIQMLKETGGNKLEAAKRLGIGRQTLYNKIKAYGIEV